MMTKHNFINRVLASAAKAAGLGVRVEPDTYSLLLGEFSKSDCRRIFPKYVSKKYRERFDEVGAGGVKRALVQAKVDALPPSSATM